MILTADNYYSQEADMEFLSVSQFKSFSGTGGRPGCEFHAMKKLLGDWTDPPTTALLVGSYVDAYYEGNLKPWDYMAGWLLCLEAGGLVTDDEGGPFGPGRTVCASNGRIHAELLAAMHAGDALLAEGRPGRA